MASETNNNSYFMENGMSLIQTMGNGHQYYPNASPPNQNSVIQHHQDHQNANHSNLIENNAVTMNGNTPHRWNGQQHNGSHQNDSEVNSRHHSQNEGGNIGPPSNGMFNHFSNARNSWHLNTIPQCYQRLYNENTMNLASNGGQVHSQHIADHNCHVKQIFHHHQQGSFLIISSAYCQAYSLLNV